MIPKKRKLGRGVALVGAGMSRFGVFKEKSSRDLFVDAFLAMKEIDPDARILLTSGFKKDERVDEVIARGVAGFIQKPYTMEHLLKALWDVIQNP